MDPYSFQPMVTCTVGTYDVQDRLTGTVTVDLKLEGLEDDVKAWEKKTGGYLAILDRNGTFLSFPQAGEKAKRISTDDSGNKSENFLSVSEFAAEQPLFMPISDAVVQMDQDILAKAQAMPGFDTTLADKINRDSYQIDAQDAEFMAALLADPLAEQTQKTFLYKTIRIEDDFILGEPALVFLFHVPNAYWKYVLVKPLSEATAVATNLTQTLQTKISMLILAVIALAYLTLSYSIVRRLRGIVFKVDLMGELVSQGKVSELKTVKVHQAGNDELGVLAGVVNSISTEFADKHHQVEEMNHTLEQKVAERTKALAQKARDIQSILQNMHQGVFTILPDHSIHPEYAKHLETILQTQDIAGQHYLSLVFAQTDLDADRQDQLKTAVAAIIGEDLMMFDFNHHLLPAEVNLSLPDKQTKNLEIDWGPIVNEADEVEKLLVTVRDVTQLRALQSEAEHQKRELSLIGQILAVSQEKFQEFIRCSKEFVELNRKLLETNKEKNLECVAELFRNMHTIKGNSRTFGFIHLTALVHEAETVYDNLRKDPEAQWQCEEMLGTIDQISELLGEYEYINEHKLGRKGAGRRGDANKYHMVESAKISKKITTLESVDFADVDALRQACNEVLNELHLIGTESIDDILTPVLDSVETLAEELGKPIPKVHLASNSIMVKNQVASLLKNTFMHVFRNSLDHGIEDAEQRVQAGKAAQGNIHLELMLDEAQVIFKYWDDGRGLGLERIREKALANGLLKTGEDYSDSEVAMLIFSSGLSTAEAVSEISGRGVGMDAVKKFIEREQGTIEILFTDSADEGRAFRRFLMVITLPRKFAVVDKSKG